MAMELKYTLAGFWKSPIIVVICFSLMEDYSAIVAIAKLLELALKEQINRTSNNC